MNVEHQEGTQITLLNIDALNNTLQYLNSMLDKANLKGTYTLDESFRITLSLNNIVKAISGLDSCQKVLEQHGKCHVQQPNQSTNQLLNQSQLVKIV